MQGKKLEKGVGYVTIYQSNNMKIELSAKGTFLRETFVRNGISHEYLYEQVTDPARIREIEDKSVNWKTISVTRSKNESYYVSIQKNAKNKHTGNIKIVKKSRATLRGMVPLSVDARQEGFSYYVKRKG